jgi:Riboflavin kinase
LCISIVALRADAQFFALLHLQVHVFDHKFASDFYGKDMNVLICGFLRYAL